MKDKSHRRSSSGITGKSKSNTSSNINNNITSSMTKRPEWANMPVLPGMKLATGSSTGSCTEEYVVSLVVEIVSCSNLAASEFLKVPLADAYVKVKLATTGTGTTSTTNTTTTTSSNNKKQSLDIHKTKPISQTNNPHYTLESKSSFVIDGMPVAYLYQAEGLLFKVKHAGDKTELGYLHVTPNALLQATGQDQVIELIHPNTLLPGVAGALTIRCRPAESSDVEFYKFWGYGYFKEYNKYDPAHDDPAATTKSKKKDKSSSKTTSKLWKVSMFGPHKKKKTSKLKKETPPNMASAMVVAASATAAAVEPTTTTTTTYTAPEIVTAPSTDDTVDCSVLDETPAMKEPVTEPQGEGNAATTKEHEDAEIGESEQTKDVTVMSALTDDYNNNSNIVVDDEITTSQQQQEHPAVDPYKAGEVEDLAEATTSNHLMCPDDCFTGNCVIL
ncbi:expressed unknown protein [Seminavis robusta]|uniref:Uncharacterized protein n=1 Tax=Seminavis robusta TaxID=568900 RepID=A0A9N8DYS0_9STRA|nr:expressed unknown protein [Seminavis robusta]|eukprot:Sro483_g151970.1 n/a (445) ;mRNA; r:3995-6184